jgi:FkbM family methyltransferase
VTHPAYHVLIAVREAVLQLAAGRRGLARTVNGFTFRVDPRTRWQFSGCYDPGAVARLRTLVQSGDVIWNVGANVGVYVLQLAQLVGPTGRVVAFEPNPVAADLIEKNVNFNDFGNRVTVVRAAVGREPGEMDFFSVGADPMGRPGQANPLLPNAAPIRVPVTTLDLALTHGRPAGIVMDIEGWEIAALLSGTALMSTAHAPWFVVELHPDAWSWSGQSRVDLETLLEERDFDLVALSGQQDPLSVLGHVLLTRRSRPESC